MLKTTDIESIKQSVMLPLLMLPIKPVAPFELGLVDHPFLEYATVVIPNNGKVKYGNILTHQDTYRRWIVFMKKRIADVSAVQDFYIMVRKSYRLTFYKFARHLLSQEDSASILADAWTSSENPNQDVNCSINEIIQWFKEADKSQLMTSEDFGFFQNIPERLQLYRGVAVGRESDGLSWTDDLQKAKWFANRFNTIDHRGYVKTAVVNKSDILSYFNIRDEREYVVNIRQIKPMIWEEK